MKTIKFKSQQILLAALFGLFIIAGTANAKGTETGFVSSHENVVEQQLEVEDWMVSDNFWNATELSTSFSLEAENALELEDWMTNEDNWKPESLVIIQNATEKELSLDCWMVQDSYWKI